jgi:hypothetical protein
MRFVSPALLLRVGLAFTFLYAAFGSFAEPVNWIGFFPRFVFGFGLPDELVLGAFSLYEIGLGLWLLWGKKAAWAALASGATLGGIVVFNIGAMDIVFRDVGLLFAALALAKISK